MTTNVVELELGLRDDVDFMSNAEGSWCLISRQHDDFDACSAALLDYNIDLWSRWIGQRHETNECKSGHGEPANRKLNVPLRLPLFPFACIELELFVEGTVHRI